MTAALGLGGYSLLLCWRRAPTHDPLPPFRLPQVQQLPAPETLPSAPFAPPTMAPLMTAQSAAAVELRVRLRGAPATLPEAGVAVFQADSGADGGWAPLARGTLEPNGDRLFRLPAFARGDVQVVFSPTQLAARHGYLARCRTPVSATSSTAEVLLDATTTTVTLRLPPGVDRAGPVRLTRADDPNWLPMAQGSADFTLTDGQPLQLLLGAGDYEVILPLRSGHSQPFAVPPTTNLILRFDPTTPRAARQ